VPRNHARPRRHGQDKCHGVGCICICMARQLAAWRVADETAWAYVGQSRPLYALTTFPIKESQPFLTDVSFDGIEAGPRDKGMLRSLIIGAYFSFLRRMIWLWTCDQS